MKKLFLIIICCIFFIKTAQCVCVTENNQIFFKLLDLECNDTKKQLLEYIKVINNVVLEDLKYLNTEQEVQDYISFLKHMLHITENFYVIRLNKYIVSVSVLKKLHQNQWNIWYDYYNIIQD